MIVALGLDRVIKKFSKMSKMNDLDMKTVSEMARNDVLKHFRDERGQTFKWPGLKHRSGKPLQDTGRLKGSIKASHEPRKAEVSTNVHYAGFHDGGAPRANIPQREFMWLSKEAEKLISKIIGRKIAR